MGIVSHAIIIPPLYDPAQGIGQYSRRINRTNYLSRLFRDKHDKTPFGEMSRIYLVGIVVSSVSISAIRFVMVKNSGS